jgi:hypothetical protein
MKQQPNVAAFFLTPEDMKALAPNIKKLAPKSAAGIEQSSRPKATRQTRRTDKFALVPLWWAESAAAAGRNINFMVCIDLVYRAWLVRGSGKTFIMPNRKGVDPRTKIHTLRSLEKAGLITVEWRERKSPVVTLAVSIF